MTSRTAWQCPNCSRWNAPHIDVCDCKPDRGGYTFNEVMDKFFPNHTQEELERQSEPTVIRDGYFDYLKQISKPSELPSLEQRGFNWMNQYRISTS